MAENKVSDRLMLFLQTQGINARRFELSIGASNGYAKSITKGISAERLYQINRVYPMLNTEWLLTGEGEMINSQQQSGEKNTQIVKNSNNVNSSSTLDKAIDEIAAQRKLVLNSQEQVNRLLSIIEKMTDK